MGQPPFAYQIEEVRPGAATDHARIESRCVGIGGGEPDSLQRLDDKNGKLPDRNSIPTDVPFFQALRERIPEICHRHGMLAIGGMTAIFPDRAHADFNKKALEMAEVE